MDTLDSTTHLKREIGDERFAALINPENTGKVREFCDQLIKDFLPTEITVGNRTYEVLPVLREGDGGVVKGDVMVERAKKMNANLGSDDGQHLLDHQDEIPEALRGKVVFIFTDWRHPAYSEGVYYVHWNGDRWVGPWYWLDNDFFDVCRVLRRK